jgi:hypothetical protein
VWQIGETIRQVHHFQLPNDTPAPIVYWVSVGLYRESEAERIPVTADGNLLPDSAVRLGPLTVTRQHYPPPNQTLDYQLGASIRLTGYDLQVSTRKIPPSSQTDVLTITLHWQAIIAPEQDLKVFVQLYDEKGSRIAQHDSPPRDGDFPTWAWQKGDIVPDPHTLLLPVERGNGPYHVLLGLYWPEDGTRLPVFDQTGQRIPNDTVILNDIYLVDESTSSGR